MVLQLLNPAISFPALQTGYTSPNGTGTRFLLCALLLGCPQGQRSIKNNLPSMSKKDKMANGTPRGFCVSHHPPPPPLLWGRFLQGGDGLPQVVWRTDLEVDLTRTQNYCEELLALYLRRTIIEIQYLDEVVNQRGSCRNNALPQSPQEKL